METIVLTNGVVLLSVSSRKLNGTNIKIPFIKYIFSENILFIAGVADIVDFADKNAPTQNRSKPMQSGESYIASLINVIL